MSLSFLIGAIGVTIKGNALLDSRYTFVWSLCCKDKTTSSKKPKETYLLCYRFNRKWIGHGIVTFSSDKSSMLINADKEEVNVALDEMKETTPAVMNRAFQDMIQQHFKGHFQEEERTKMGTAPKIARKEEEAQNNIIELFPEASSEVSSFDTSEAEPIYCVIEGQFVQCGFLRRDKTVTIFRPITEDFGMIELPATICGEPAFPWAQDSSAFFP